MAYAIKEMFFSLQGEGAQTGRPAVFCRFAGCNLWSGREADRGDAACPFCDTDFVGVDGPNGGRYAVAEDVAIAIERAWAGGGDHRFVVFTGGEPLLQLDAELLAAARRRGFMTAVETNGTLPLPSGIDWLTVSPKAGSRLVIEKGSEMKLVYPQAGIDPGDLEGLAFDHFWLQPMDGPARDANTAAAIEYCLSHPRWRLSVQTHKLIGIP